MRKTVSNAVVATSLVLIRATRLSSSMVTTHSLRLSKRTALAALFAMLFAQFKMQFTCSQELRFTKSTEVLLLALIIQRNILSELIHSLEPLSEQNVISISLLLN